MHRHLNHIFQVVLLSCAVLSFSACNENTGGSTPVGDDNVTNDSNSDKADDSAVIIDTEADNSDGVVDAGTDDTTVIVDDGEDTTDSNYPPAVDGSVTSDIDTVMVEEGGIPVNDDGETSADVVSVNPREAIPGELITVEGQNFGDTHGAKTLDINGVPATDITDWTDTEIMVKVPVGALTGDVSVTEEGVTGMAAKLVVPWLSANPDNVLISSLPAPQQYPQLASDGSHGAIITWMDWRDSTTGYDIYAQRVNSRGYPLWPADDGVGREYCT